MSVSVCVCFCVFVCGFFLGLCVTARTHLVYLSVCVCVCLHVCAGVLEIYICYLSHESPRQRRRDRQQEPNIEVLCRASEYCMAS